MTIVECPYCYVYGEDFSTGDKPPCAVHGFYVHGQRSLNTGCLDWAGEPMQVLFLDTYLYAAHLGAHRSRHDIPRAAQIASIELRGKHIDRHGRFQANDVTLPCLAWGTHVGALVICRKTRRIRWDTLLCYLGKFSPITGGGGPVHVEWDRQRGLFSL
jgi:hypothetical protein